MKCIQCNKSAHLQERNNPSRVYCNAACQLIGGLMDFPEEVIEHIITNVRNIEDLYTLMDTDDRFIRIINNLAFHQRYAARNPDIVREHLRALFFDLGKFDTDEIARWLEPAILGGAWDPTSYDNHAIYEAAKINDTRLIQILLNDPRVDPTAVNNRAVMATIESGYTEALSLFLKDPRIGIVDYDASEFIVIHNHIHILLMLLNDGRYNPVHDNGHILLGATVYNRLKIVQLLLLVLRVRQMPRAILKHCLMIAVEMDHLQIAQLFISILII